MGTDSLYFEKEHFVKLNISEYVGDKLGVEKMIMVRVLFSMLCFYHLKVHIV